MIDEVLVKLESLKGKVPNSDVFAQLDNLMDEVKAIIGKELDYQFADKVNSIRQLRKNVKLEKELVKIVKKIEKVEQKVARLKQIVEKELLDADCVGRCHPKWDKKVGKKRMFKIGRLWNGNSGSLYLQTPRSI